MSLYLTSLKQQRKKIKCFKTELSISLYPKVHCVRQSCNDKYFTAKIVNTYSNDSYLKIASIPVLTARSVVQDAGRNARKNLSGACICWMPVPIMCLTKSHIFLIQKIN